jgi:DNA-binding transcriptional regulator YhcF (GntR family)
MGVLLSLDDSDARPIYLQLVLQVKEQVRRGALRPGDDLPSVRELASELGINLHTVHKAYQALRDDAVILLRLGRVPRVAPLRQGPAERRQVEARITVRVSELITEAFHLGLSRKDFRSLVEELLKADPGGGR